MESLEFKKQTNNIIRKAHNDSKLEYCACCKKNVSSFCNSHSLPKFILKSISNNGYVLTSNNYSKIPIIDNSKGLNNAGVFKRICNDCDNLLFKDYETSEKLLDPRKKIMTQIDLKNSLRMYDKRLNEIAIYKNLETMNIDISTLQEIIEKQKINYLDLNEIEREIKRDLEILSKSSTSSFKLIFSEKLNYVVPIAFQGHIALVGDLNGDTINDIYNKSESNVVENINICVFPLTNQTIIMMFINNDYKKYKKFIKQFGALTKEKKLQLISYIIFNYSEDFFVSKDAKKEIIDNKTLDIVAQNTTDIHATDEKEAKLLKKSKEFELLNYKEFPNILSKEYSIR